jgi:hypothetical protein
MNSTNHWLEVVCAFPGFNTTWTGARLIGFAKFLVVGAAVGPAHVHGLALAAVQLQLHRASLTNTLAERLGCRHAACARAVLSCCSVLCCVELCCAMLCCAVQVLMGQA